MWNTAGLPEDLNHVGLDVAAVHVAGLQPGRRALLTRRDGLASAACPLRLD